VFEVRSFSRIENPRLSYGLASRKSRKAITAGCRQKKKQKSSYRRTSNEEKQVTKKKNGDRREKAFARRGDDKAVVA